MTYLDDLIQTRLQGDKKRIVELFEDEELIDDLINNSKKTDWYRFSPDTFDGEYIVKIPNGYSCYQQDRGIKLRERSFAKLSDAAAFMFND